MDRHRFLNVINEVRTYIGLNKISLIVANLRTNEWDWIFTDPHFGDYYVPFSGSLEDARALKAEYETPATDLPF